MVLSRASGVRDLRIQSDLVAPSLPPGRSSTIDVDGRTYERVVVRTPWLRPGDDLAGVMVAALRARLRPGDWAMVSEKAVIIAEGLGLDAADYPPGRLARLLAARVQPTEGSRGLSIPEKMQLVVRRTGLARVLLATAAAGLTRPLGLHGVFYVVAGRQARATDGMRPPFEHLLLPPLEPGQAGRIARRLAAALGVPVAIVDINDRGGSVRAVSERGMSPRLLRRILRDNPLGQRDTRTPIGLIRLLVSPEGSEATAER